MSREPLDASERALADALARLPALEPPPALDARVLAQAREALRPAAPRLRRHRPWWMGAGLGTAAAAVLAAGAAWQLGVFDIRIGSDVPVPRMPERSAASDGEQPVAIDLRHAPSPAAAPAPPPPPGGPIPAAPAPAPAAPPAASVMRQQGAPQAMSESEAQPFPDAARERSAARKADAPAAVQPRHEAPAAAPADTTLDSVSVTGSRMIPDTSRILPHWREDASLPPDEWLERIRERVRRGERPGAASSLRRFTAQHPTRPVPEDLVLLLVR